MHHCCSCEDFCDFVFPVVWVQIAIGYRIETLRPQLSKDALELIKKYYFKQNLLFRTSGFLNDEDSKKNFLDHVNDIIKADSSLCLIEEKNETLVGILLLSVVNKFEFRKVMSHTTLNIGEAYEKCIELRNALQKKVDYFLDYDTNCFLRFYLLCIADEHRGKELGYHMYRTAIEFARHMRIPIASGVFTSKPYQLLAERVGFEYVHSVSYNQWLDDNGLKLMDPCEINTTVALMVARIPSFYVSPINYSNSVKTTKEKDKTKDKKKEGKGKQKK